MNEDLPSINDFIEDTSQLPSLNEEVESELPSVEDFIEKEEEVLTEEVQPLVVENADNSTEVIVQLIETVRNSIPEVKSYDKELYELMNLIEEVRREIPEIPEPPEMPEIRYYDDQISDLQESIVGVRDSIPEVPEVRYYDEQISQLQESIEEVKERDIPDFRWISKSFSVINEDFDNLSDTLATLKGRLDLEVGEIVESIDVSKFETGVDVKRLDDSITSTREEITNNLSEVKEKIYEELRDASLRIWNLNKEFKADDKALKKKIDEEYKALSISIDEVFEHSKGNHEIATAYFEDLKEEIRSLPEVKYYDKEIDKVNQSISSVKNLVEVLENKLNKKIAGLKESILVVPPTENNPDPLTPLDQNFATLDDLSNHYRTFLNRIQTQLATLGGGGEVRLEFLDDIDRDTAKVDGKFLKYEASSGKWVGATGGGGGGISASGTSGQILQHNGTEYVGVSSVGIATFINDYHQGYYRYSTNFYTTGVANTVQNLPADEFVTIQPSVRTNKVDFMPEKMLIANSNDPWIGAGATIGTGQTQFSLAGLDAGSTVIVRIASQFNPDDDQTNLDFRLNFTTNPTTQGYGTTNFSITREQALICNEGADQNYISEILMNFYVGSSLSGSTKATAGSFNLQARASNEGDFEMMALTINVVA
tara:strand:- start:554 stop:2512 length:1959 start_codon:yes stop_codon:yes gene_type:complete